MQSRMSSVEEEPVVKLSLREKKIMKKMTMFIFGVEWSVEVKKWMYIFNNCEWKIKK